MCRTESERKNKCLEVKLGSGTQEIQTGVLCLDLTFRKPLNVESGKDWRCWDQKTEVSLEGIVVIQGRGW